MAKTAYIPKRSAPKLPRYVGLHADCGGGVFYSSSPTMGYRWCDKCKASSLNGLSPDTVEEKARWAKEAPSAP